MRANSFHPTTNQKQVIAVIIASPTPQVAGGELSNGTNIVAARNQLMKMGIITFSQEGGAELTAAGNQIATDENIIDQAGELTPAGQALAYGSQQPMESSHFKFLKELLFLVN